MNDIFCQSLPGSPLKPHNLEQLEKQQEMMKMPFRRAKEVGGFFLVFCFFFFFFKFESVYYSCYNTHNVKLSGTGCFNLR